MRHSPRRRALLRMAAYAPFVAGLLGGGGVEAAADPKPRFAALEAGTGGRLGIAVLDAAGAPALAYRESQRFAFCSTFKFVAIGALLQRSMKQSGFLERRIVYSKERLLTYSPITQKHVGEGMSIADLCAAALQYSDNTAANLIIETVGGPAAVTAFARSIGDATFRLDRWETALNTAVPGDPRDTSTPAAMAKTLQRLALGDVLGEPQRHQLIEWMRGNATGANRIRAGLPEGWSAADKTGTGEYGATNDIGLIWPPGKPPLVIAVYFTQGFRQAPARDDIIAQATRIAVEALG